MKKLIPVIVLIIGILPFYSFSQTYRQISPEAVKELLQEKVQVLDVRTGEEFAEGHLPGAVLANWKDQKAFRKSVRKLSKKQPILIYCKSGNRSKSAAEWMIKKGFKEIYELEGGIMNYRKKENE